MRKSRKKFIAIVDASSVGFGAYIEYKGDIITTVGDTLTQVANNMVEALNLYLEEHGDYIKVGNINFKIDLKEYFKQHNYLNAKNLARRIKMNPTLLSQYVNGKKLPSPKQTERIINGIVEVGKDLAAIRL